MDRGWRLALVAGGVAVAVVLFFVLRDSGSDNESAASTPGATTRAATMPKPQATTIVVRGGQVVGGLMRISATKGDRVAIVVRADVSDEVHVHGYNRTGDVTPSAPARIGFRANLVGRFEIELESRSFQIAELEVNP